ncbi:MAG: slipin family protein [Candidatus Hatepunaea meridiana]|nr:slipin family protein [Candidatus Hatepunaea meridiana]
MLYLLLSIVVIFILSSAIRILNEYERGVIFRLGRLIGSKGPGLILLIPIVDKMVKVSLRLETRDVPPQDVITKDNVSVQVNAVIYFRVMNPSDAVVKIENYTFATLQFAQTTLRSVLGQVELDDLLASRDTINQQLQAIIDKHTDPWGIKVANVEIKHVDLPQEMRRAWAKQSEAERERRAKITHAEGEYQASIKLAEAAKVIAKEPIALQLRYLQTLNEVAVENNSTVIFPIPIDLLTPFMNKPAALPEGKDTDKS